MDSAQVPLIYSPRALRIRAGPVGRLVALGASAVCLYPLIVAATLKPDPSGLGTHTQLGMAPCAFQRSTGLPCPTCGMTTSWAWLARGNVAASLWIQPMGTLLFVLAAMGFWAGLYIAVTGRAAHHLIRYLPTGYTFTWLLTLAALAWAWKVFIQLHGMDGWR